MVNIDPNTDVSQDVSVNNLPDVVFDRLKQAGGLRFDTDLAADMGVERTSIGKWRKRGTLPMETLLGYASTKGYSLDWLFFGAPGPNVDEDKYAVEEPQATYSADIDSEIFHQIAARVRQLLIEQNFTPQNEDDLAKIDRLTCYAYNEIKKTDGDFTDKKLLDLFKLIS